MVQAGTTVQIVDSGSLSVDGSIGPLGLTPIAIGLTAAALGLSGLVSDGGAGATSLVATRGTIAQGGTLIAGTLSGSSGGRTHLTGHPGTVHGLHLFTFGFSGTLGALPVPWFSASPSFSFASRTAP